MSVDRSSPLPLHEQLTEQIRLQVEAGELEPGDSLPTIKEASRSLAVNTNTVATAYRALEQEGYLTQRKRAGTAVAAAPPERLDRALTRRLAAETARRARAAGISPAELTRAVAVHSLLEAAVPRLKVAVLAGTRQRAAEQARRVLAALGDDVDCVPLTPDEYESVHYHLAVIAPELGDRLGAGPAAAPSPQPVPPHLSYSPEFPAAAD